MITGLRAEKCLCAIAWMVGPLCLLPFRLRVLYHREKERERVRGLKPNEGGQLDPDWEPRESEKKKLGYRGRGPSGILGKF